MSTKESIESWNLNIQEKSKKELKFFWKKNNNSLLNWNNLESKKMSNTKSYICNLKKRDLFMKLKSIDWRLSSRDLRQLSWKRRASFYPLSNFWLKRKMSKTNFKKHSTEKKIIRLQEILFKKNWKMQLITSLSLKKRFTRLTRLP